MKRRIEVKFLEVLTCIFGWLSIAAARKASKKILSFEEIKAEILDVLRNAPNKPGGTNYVKDMARWIQLYLSQEVSWSRDQNIFATEPSFDVPIINITVVAGKIAILPCSVDYLGDHKVVWTDQFSTLLTFDIQRIIDDDRISIDRPYINDWNLLIHDVRFTDKGKYICQINTKPVKTKAVELFVLVPPKIIKMSSTRDVTATEGETVNLKCNVSGTPPPTVHWYRRPITEHTTHKERVGMNGEILVIHNISRYCDGIYECVAFNDVPPAVNHDIMVQVEFQPEILLLNKRMGQYKGKNTILDCIVTAFPQGISMWKFKGEHLKNSKKHATEVYNDGKHQITLSLRIYDINDNDYGEYECYAENKLGRDDETMVLYEVHSTTKALTTTGHGFAHKSDATRKYEVTYIPKGDYHNHATRRFEVNTIHTSMYRNKDRLPTAASSNMGNGTRGSVDSKTALFMVLSYLLFCYLIDSL